MTGLSSGVVIVSSGPMNEMTATAVAVADGEPVVQPSTAALAAASAERRRNSRRYIPVSRAPDDLSMAPPSDVLPIDVTSRRLTHRLFPPGCRALPRAVRR